MTLLLQPLGAAEDVWIRELAKQLPDERIRVWPDVGILSEIEFAAVSKLPDGALADFPSLKLVCTLLSGQDILLSDPQLPDVPIVRTDGREGDESMTETVLAHVLRHHCQLPQYAIQQAERVWKRLPHKSKQDTQVAFLGLGLIGLAAAQRVAHEGFRVAGWSRTPKDIDGVKSYTGRDGLREMLATTDILVNLLQLTPETHGLLKHDVLSCLPHGASLINLARGAHLPKSALYWALDQGILGAVTLDVFEEEPPPEDARVWSDPRVTLTPHVARLEYSVPAAALRIGEAIREFRAGHPLTDIVDRRRGY